MPPFETEHVQFGYHMIEDFEGMTEEELKLPVVVKLDGVAYLNINGVRLRGDHIELLYERLTD